MTDPPHIPITHIPITTPDGVDPAAMSDSAKLRALADWFDAYDQSSPGADKAGDGVQRDLRRIADRIAVVPQSLTFGSHSTIPSKFGASHPLIELLREMDRLQQYTDQPNPSHEPSPEPGSPATLTVYVSIGNSDDKLSQLEWYEFQQDVLSDIKEACARIFGVWYSEAVSPYQNMCVGFEISDVALRDDSRWYHDNVAKLRDDLALLCEHFKQESIAWAVVQKTEFIKPVMR